MLTFFESLLLGHLLGDYVFQNTWMASRKGAKYLPCVVHCLIYTFCVVAMTSWSPWWALVVFLSHFPIDKYSLADKWMKATKSRSLEVFLEKGHEGTPFEYEEDTPGFHGIQGFYEEKELNKHKNENYIILRGGFTTFAYAIVDNTFHFILMLLGAMYLKRWGLM